MGNKYSIILVLLCSVFLNSQVAVGKSTVDGDAILDFGTDGDKGILLPRVITLNATSIAGTLYYDTNDSKVKFLGSSVMDLSVKNVEAGNEFDTTAGGYNTLTESVSTNGVILGAETSSSIGVLILERTDKALVLPKATSYTNIGNPEGGMIVYDNTKKMFCAFDGEKWAFWGK